MRFLISKAAFFYWEERSESCPIFSEGLLYFYSMNIFFFSMNIFEAIILTENVL